MEKATPCSPISPSWYGSERVAIARVWFWRETKAGFEAAVIDECTAPVETHVRIGVFGCFGIGIESIPKSGEIFLDSRASFLGITGETLACFAGCNLSQ